MAGRVVKPGFYDDVARVVRRVPSGSVTTYGDVAAALGARSVARHVGWALAGLPEGHDVPWHRVVNAAGRISARGDAPGGDVQRALLEAEGLEIDEAGKIAGFAAVRIDVEGIKADGGGASPSRRQVDKTGKPKPPSKRM